MNKKNLLLAIAFALFLLPAKLVFAQNNVASNSSGSAEQEQENANSTINNIKKVIQEKKTELGTVGANLRSERAYLAKILRVSEETLTVNNYSGNKIIPLEESVLIQKDNETIKIDQIAVDDWVGIQGEMINDNLKIKKVSVYERNFSPKEKIISIGSIATLGKNDLKFSPRSGDKELNLSFDKNTNFENYQGETAKLSDFYEDMQCLVVAFADKNGNYVISTIRALSDFDK
jgi:hypothetical protein